MVHATLYENSLSPKLREGLPLFGRHNNRHLLGHYLDIVAALEKYKHSPKCLPVDSDLRMGFYVRTHQKSEKNKNVRDRHEDVLEEARGEWTSETLASFAQRMSGEKKTTYTLGNCL